MTLRVLLDYDEFAERIAVEFGLPRATLVPAAALVADLLCDSLLLFELVLFVEELAGVTLPEALIPQIVTVDDLHTIYVTRATQQT